MVVTLSAFALYLGNVTIGLLAQFRGRRFGAWHHVAYAVVFAAAISAAMLEPDPRLLLTLGSLAAMPRAKPHTAWHPGLAALGALGYVLTLTSSGPLRVG